MNDERSNAVVMTIVVLAIIITFIVSDVVISRREAELEAQRIEAERREEEARAQEAALEEARRQEEAKQQAEADAAAEDAERAALEAERKAFFAGISSDTFEDALFIGDSRTDGIDIYGNIDDATYFANTGMSIYSVEEEKIDIKEFGTTTLDNLLTQKEFRKIYVMLGCNEIRSDIEKTVQKNEEFLAYLQEKQPTAIIIYQANLHFSEKRNKGTDDNTRFKELHMKIKAFADNEKVFYIDANPLFDDEYGNMNADLTWDGAHLYAKHYNQWCDWIREETKKIVNNV